MLAKQARAKLDKLNTDIVNTQKAMQDEIAECINNKMPYGEGRWQRLHDLIKKRDQLSWAIGVAEGAMNG